MPGDKRQRGGGGGGNEDRSAKRRRYAAAAGKSKARAAAGEIRGPGLWLSCVRRKEAISTSEAYDLLNDVADRLYPETSRQATASTSNGAEGQADEDQDDIEAQIAKELEELQPARDPETGKKKMRFQGARTDTECLVWISCAPPIDPIKITYAIADDLQNGAPVRTRFLQRITPVSNTTHADPNSLKTLAYRLLQPLIAPSDYTLKQRESDEPIKYRIEPILRNHTQSLNRQVVTDLIGDVARDLANPSFQFQKRRIFESKEDGEDNREETASAHVAEEASAEATEEASAEATPEQIPASEVAVPVEATIDSEKADQSVPQEEQAIEAPAQETVTAEDEPEEIPWHILSAYRRRIFVDLKHPTHTILVSALRGVVGLSVVERYDERKKFNVQMLSGTLPVRKEKKANTEQDTGETEVSEETSAPPPAEPQQAVEPDTDMKAGEAQSAVEEAQQAQQLPEPETEMKAGESQRTTVEADNAEP